MVKDFSKTSIVTSFDEKYFDYAAVMVKSLCNNYHEKSKLNLTCLVPKNLLERKTDFIRLIDSESLEIEFINSVNFNNFLNTGVAHESRYITQNMYHRLFIGSTLNKYDKAIYIDPDTLILRDIKPLLTYEINLPIAAVVEYSKIAFLDLGLEDIPYFNNGVFITDLKYWRNENIEEKLVNWLLENKKKDCPEQSAMNEIFKFNWSPLPLNFNLLAFKLFEDKSLTENYKNPLIVHFVGDLKPWGDTEVPIWTEKWKDIYKSIFEN
tara:strand:- start:4166 stop:4963 length:798 start_codon:yes stop_codon:yes gene_type:complete